MKKLILVVLSIISYCSYAEVNTKVYNNYIVFYAPEYAPHSTLIKKQEIDSSIKDSDLSGKIVIDSNDDGLITSIDLKDHQLNMTFDYANNIFNVNYKHANFAKLKLILNSNNEIVEIESLYSNINFHYNHSYDDIERIKMSECEKFNKNFIMEFVYKNEGLLRTIYIDNRTEKDKNLTPYFKKVDYIYDDENKVKRAVYADYLDKDYLKIKETTNCYFSDYNEHGDWTKSYCIKDNKVKIGNITRKIEYW